MEEAPKQDAPHAPSEAEAAFTAALMPLVLRLHMAAAILPAEIDGDSFRALLDTLEKLRASQQPGDRRLTRLLALLHAAREFRIEARAFANG